VNPLCLCGAEYADTRDGRHRHRVLYGHSPVEDSTVVLGADVVEFVDQNGRPLPTWAGRS